MRLAFVAADMSSVRVCGEQACQTRGAKPTVKVHRLDVYTDSDCALDQERKSVSCVVTMMGTHCLRLQVATQTARALSSSEAESVTQRSIIWKWYAIHGTRHGTKSRDQAPCNTDITAGTGIARMVGLGKIRHLDTGLPWIQRHVSHRNLQIHKVAGPDNEVDIGTKNANAVTLTKVMKAMKFEEATGSHPRTLKVAHDQG